MEVRHARLPSGGADQLNIRPDTGPSSGAHQAASIYSTVQKQDYCASVWLSKTDKLEYSQQKCIVVFALVCCFGVLVALIFSAVDVLGEDEGGITEENCSKNCRVVLVENIPEDISISPEGTMPLATGLHNLLDLAQKSVEIVSPWWALNATEQESHFPHAKQGQLLLQRLMGLKTENVHLKVASGITPSEELALLSHCGAEVHYLNMTALTRGRLHSSFWVVDRKHMYIGSAGMDWRSLSTLKELGVIIYECSCLVLDLHRIFSLYWQLQYRDFVPSIWSKRLYAIFNKEEPLELLLNGTSAKAYVSTSPDLFCPKDRTRDIEAIFHLIQEARKFIYISMSDYLPLLSNSAHTCVSLFPGEGIAPGYAMGRRRRQSDALGNVQLGNLGSWYSYRCYLNTYHFPKHYFQSYSETMRHVPFSRYWSQIDGMLREALILRQVKVRLLISCWEQMHPLTFNFLWSLKSLCMDMANCSAEAKFFSPRLRDDGSLQGINHHRYMVTDTSVYIGNFDWVGNEFVYNAGAGLVLSQRDAGPTVLERMRGVFDRDWRSPYSKTLQPNMVPMCGANAVFPGPRLKDYPGSIEQEHSPNTSL